MKILIIAYHFYPDITPRSFRAFELVKQLAKEGHEVTVLLPKSDFDYKDVCEKYNFKIDFTDYQKASSTLSNNAPKKENLFLKKIIKLLFENLTYCIFPSGRGVKFYFYAVYKKLKNYNTYHDMIISIAAPFETHIGTVLAFKKNKKLNATHTKIADYGDPLYRNPALPNCFLYYWIDKFIASSFDFITVPTEKALSTYQVFKKPEFVKVIPQGFNFSNTKLADYVKNKVSTFGYAGIFYKDIRNPKPLLEYLIKLDKDGFAFKFIVYTTILNFNNMKLLEKYKSILKNKLIINASIPREEVIYELSKMDFLINIENLSASQTPSKLIDYALAKRPIFSFNQLNFSKDLFMEFFEGKYKNATKVDLNQFDIKRISKQFLDLDIKLQEKKT